MFYTYLWLRENCTPYYVGKGKGKRAFISKDHTVSRPKYNSRIFVQCWESEEKAFEMEKWYIAFYGRKDNGTGCLRNLTDGGDGPSGWIPSEGTKEKIKEARKLQTFSEETKSRMSISGKGRRKSEEHKQKIRESNIRTYIEKGRSETWYQKQRDSHKGKIQSPESIRKRVEKMTGRKRKPCSEETKEKIRKSILEYFANRIYAV